MSTETKSLSRIDVLKNIMKAPSVIEQFDNALKENRGPFVASIIDLYNSDKTLQRCDPKQVVMEALKAATLKLPINKQMGFAYIIPYRKGKDEVIPQFQMGYKGYIQLAMRTGQYRIINADVVLEGEYRKKNKLTGEFDLSGEPTSEKIIGYFAYFEMLNGFSKTLYMDLEKVTAWAKRYSKSYGKETSPWHTNFDEMAIKTCLRNLLSHWGFLSVELMSAMNQDQESDSVDDRVDQEMTEKANKSQMDFTEAEEAEVVDDNERKPNF